MALYFFRNVGLHLAVFNSDKFSKGIDTISYA